MVTKHLITLVLFLYLVMPVKVCFAQSMDNEMTQTEEMDSKDKKIDKKKAKDVIEINETFFINFEHFTVHGQVIWYEA